MQGHFKNVTGLFAGWDETRLVGFQEGMRQIVQDTMEVGFGAVLNPDTYSWYRELELPPKVRRDSRYGLCFRFCMYFAAKYAKDVGQPIDFVLERGHANAGGARTIFNDFRARCEPFYPGLLGTITYRGKDCLPLAVADLFAHLALTVESGPHPHEYESPETYTLSDQVSCVLPRDEWPPLVKMLMRQEDVSSMVRGDIQRLEARLSYGRQRHRN